MTKFSLPTFGLGTILLVLLFFLEAFTSLLENEKSEENIDIAFSPQNSTREREREREQTSSHYFWHGSRRRGVSDNGDATPPRSDRRGLEHQEASFFLPSQMRNGFDRFFRFLPRPEMQNEDKWTINATLVPRLGVWALRPKWTSVWASITIEITSVEENKVLSDHVRTHVFDVGGWFKSNEKLNGLRLIFVEYWTPFSKKLHFVWFIRNTVKLRRHFFSIISYL